MGWPQLLPLPALAAATKDGASCGVAYLHAPAELAGATRAPGYGRGGAAPCAGALRVTGPLSLDQAHEVKGTLGVITSEQSGKAHLSVDKAALYLAAGRVAALRVELL